jgi:hypothetical protein
MARLYGPGPGSPPALVATADLAGLSTSDVEGSPVGELVGALSEERSGLIRYLDVAIRNAGKHVLVPIGHVRIDRQAVPPRARLRAATQEDLLSVPEYREDETEMDARYHERVLAAHGRLFYGSRYYAHPAYDHAALRQDEPAPEEAPERGHGLRPLSELDSFRLSRRAAPLLDATLIDGAGETVGAIRDLLIELPARQPRYAVVRMEGPDRLAVVPIGYVEADGDGSASLSALTGEDVRLLPAYEPPLTREQENRLHAAIEGRLSGDRYFTRADFRPNGR